MQITLDIPDDLVVEILRRLLCSCTTRDEGQRMRATKVDYETLDYTFIDTERPGVEFKLTKDILMQRMGLLYTTLWTTNYEAPPFNDIADDWYEWSNNQDIECTEAFISLVCYGNTDNV